MALRTDFPSDPHAILRPDIRWYPGDQQLMEFAYEMLIPPLVHKIRKGVAAWRDSGYEGACDTTRSLLKFWFQTEHLIPQADGTVVPFDWYFAQREAIESAIWLYEVEKARDPYGLMKYDSSGRISTGMFFEDWTRYVMKLATGAGKTKVMSLLIAWSYFHKRYEEGSDLSTNFLLIAPNIIVLDRLRLDFDGARIFRSDPILPTNGYDGRDWDDDFQLTVHIQDEIGFVSTQGNLFLSNIHRVFEGDAEPTFDNDDTTAYFLGKKPNGKTTDSKVDLGVIVRDVPDLVVINDEAHHVHDAESAWFRSIQDISMRLRQKNSKLSAQFDLTATPKHNNGAIFVQTICDYPLVEAIRQGVVKTPVLPDEASRAKLQERQSNKFVERYEDYIHLGYLEWKSTSEELRKAGKKSILFVMTDDTKNCDSVAAYLENRYPELKDAVLVIHTKNNGDISEASTGKNKEELEKLRKLSREIDDPGNKYKAVVSVMVLREGWDVRNVVAIVGLRPYTAEAKILPEQTLGRGLRRMFWGEDVAERVSVVGTPAFIEFVESIKTEGVDLEYQPMGQGTPPKSPLVLDVDRDNKRKDIEKLDIELPVLAPRIYREYKNLEGIDVDSIPQARIPYLQYSEEQQREIVFRDIDRDKESHRQQMDNLLSPDYRSVVAFFADRLCRDLRLVRGRDILFGKIKQYVEQRLFDRTVDLEDVNTLRNLSETATYKTLIDRFKDAINALTVADKGTTEIRDYIKLSKTRAFVVKDQAYLVPTKSVFNKIVGDSSFELSFASFLDSCKDILAFAKNSRSLDSGSMKGLADGPFRIEYRTSQGTIANYYPDFLVKRAADEIWIVETKGREDLEDPPKWDRLLQWCKDASLKDPRVAYHALFVREEDWLNYPVKTFSQAITTFTTLEEQTMRIELKLNPGMPMSISPDPAYVKVGDRVSWSMDLSSAATSERLRWTVYFQHSHPFATSKGQSSSVEADKDKRSTLTTEPVETPGDYKYGVRVETAESRVQLSDDDPRLIVKR